MKVWDVLVVGAGPGGLQCGIAAASEGLEVLVLERGVVGGQIGQTPLLENSVFAQGGITGPEFAKMMRAQAEAMGARIEAGEALTLSSGKKSGIKSVVVRDPNGNEHSLKAHTVVLAMGNKWQELDIPGLRQQVGKKVHFGPVKSIGYNATGRDVAVYGGGPSAGQAILALADEKNTDLVQVLLRSTLRMPQYLVDRIQAHPKVRIREHTTIQEIHRETDGQLVVTARYLNSTVNFLVDALFMCNGLLPATGWLKGTLPLDAEGRIVNNGLETDIPGVYAIGDCRAGSTPRVGVAIGDGSMAVTKIWGYFIANPVCANCDKLGLPKKAV